jgi:hypothetical protein
MPRDEVTMCRTSRSGRQETRREAKQKQYFWEHEKALPSKTFIVVYICGIYCGLIYICGIYSWYIFVPSNDSVVNAGGLDEWECMSIHYCYNVRVLISRIFSTS